MSNANIPISLKEFRRIEKQCSRWKQRSLDAAKELVVDGKSVGEVSSAYGMTKQQADTIRVRFYAKVEAARVAEFLSRNPAENPTVEALSPYRGSIQTLNEQGASTEQIVTYLSERGHRTNQSIVSEFLESIEATGK